MKKENKIKKENKQKDKRQKGGILFFMLVLIVYFIVYIINSQIFVDSLKNFWGLFSKIIPILLLVFAIMFLSNYFIKPKKLAKFLNQKGFLGFFAAISAGIISTGPVYAWYPLLKDLRSHGLRNAFITTFIYNRAIKPQILPFMIFYLGLNVTIILTITMIVMSVFEGLLVEKIINVNILKSNKYKEINT